MSIKEKLQMHYDKVSEEYTVFGVFLYGGQNYGCDTEFSDVDSKAMVLPKINELLLGAAPVTKVIDFEDGGQCTIKDIREMMKIILKQNINFVEVLFTEHYIINPLYQDLYYELVAIRDRIARADVYTSLSCIGGYVAEKKNRVFRPSTRVSDYGYDGKELSHLVRMSEFLVAFTDGLSYGECLRSKNPKLQIELKQGNHLFIEEARKLSDDLSEFCFEIIREYKKNNSNIKDEEVGGKINQFLLKVLWRRVINNA